MSALPKMLQRLLAAVAPAESERPLVATHRWVRAATEEALATVTDSRFRLLTLAFADACDRLGALLGEVSSTQRPAALAALRDEAPVLLAAMRGYTIDAAARGDELQDPGAPAVLQLLGDELGRLMDELGRLNEELRSLVDRARGTPEELG
jgi:hypothetical protein